MDILDTIVLWKSSPTREAFKIAFVNYMFSGGKTLLAADADNNRLYKNKLDFQSKTNVECLR